jgi:hypothetical protein
MGKTANLRIWQGRPCKMNEEFCPALGGCRAVLRREAKTCLVFFENFAGNVRQLRVCFAGSGGVSGLKI